MYSTYVDEDERAAGGSTILVRDNILHSYVNLDTDLQDVAVRLTLDKTITLCSVYIPTNSSLSLTLTQNFADQLPTPFIIMSHFNGHNLLWGSKTTTDKGIQLEDFISQERLCIINDGTDTYLHHGNGFHSAIDLTVTYPSLLLDFSWKVHDDLCGSDHFPIILESLYSTVGERPTRYKFDKADWPLYEQMCREKLQTEMIRNDTDSILKFNETVISIADETIPKTSTNPKHPGKPWFNDECKDAIKNRKKAERRLGKHPTSDNLGNFRIFRAKARRTLKQNRCTS